MYGNQVIGFNEAFNQAILEMKFLALALWVEACPLGNCCLPDPRADVPASL